MIRVQVALKVIPSKNYRHNDRAKQLLRTEVAVMSRIRKLAHPHLMQFKHTFEDAEKIVMVLEFLSGEGACLSEEEGLKGPKGESALSKRGCSFVFA